MYPRDDNSDIDQQFSTEYTELDTSRQVFQNSLFKGFSLKCLSEPEHLILSSVTLYFSNEYEIRGVVFFTHISAGLPYLTYSTLKHTKNLHLIFNFF